MIIKEAEGYCTFVVNDRCAIHIDKYGVKINNNFDIERHKGWKFKEIELPEGQMECVFSHDGEYDPWPSKYVEEYYLCMINGRLGLYHTGDKWSFAPYLCVQFSNGKWEEED